MFNKIKNISNESAMMTGFIFFLPFAFISTFLIFNNLQPNLELFHSLFSLDGQIQNQILRSLSGFIILLLMLATFALNLMPILKTVQSTGNIKPHPLNFIIAVVTLAVIIIVAGGIFIG